MKTAAEYLDAIKSRNGIPSDYALAKILGVTRAQVSHYRVGRDHFSAEICERIAALLDMPAEDVLLDSAMFRAKTDSERRAWQRVIQRLGGAAAAIAAVSVIAAMPSPAEASTGAGLTALSSGHDVYYVKLKTMAAKWINDRLSALFRLLSPRLTMA